AFDAALAEAAIPGVVETLPTYRSVLVQLDPLTIDMAAFETRVLGVLGGLKRSAAKPKRWKVPVVYGGEFGIDLADVATAHGL
ncbi:carboxyltransferase domain-containing protein, partial [Acinetobacter baumannii]